MRIFALGTRTRVTSSQVGSMKKASSPAAITPTLATTDSMAVRRNGLNSITADAINRIGHWKKKTSATNRGARKGAIPISLIGAEANTTASTAKSIFSHSHRRGVGPRRRWNRNPSRISATNTL